jgi:hypothetical protein
MKFDISIIFQVTVPPAPAFVLPAFRYDGVVEVVLAAAISIHYLLKQL